LSLARIRLIRCRRFKPANASERGLATSDARQYSFSFETES
jgi:hypothetical protein